MFVEIATNGASHIYITVPHETAPTALPAIARMLEHNAVFIHKGWRELSVKKPTMTISLSDKVEVEGDGGEEVLILAGEHVIGEEFVALTPEVVTSTAKMRAKMQAEIDTLKKQAEGLKAMLDLEKTVNEDLQREISDFTPLKGEA
jgi:hypothetical protein